MCGLAGFLDTARTEPEERARIARAMAATLRARGPDHEAIRDDGRLAVAFRRLAIVDVEGGDQPIANEDESLLLVLNGEIYNHRALRAELEGSHRFRTRSDAEVVLHLFEDHGPRALDRLEGMFALAIWDARRRRLFLARDRLGIKPLYIARVRRGLLFGSELKALLAHPDCPREVAFEDCHPVFDGLPLLEHPSFVRGIELFPPGHYAVADGDALDVVKYWSFADVLDAAKDRDERRTAADFVDAYAALFEDAAAKHLQGDVPVGAFLSGGLDSALVVAATARASRDFTCFNVADATTLAAGDVAAARAVAAHVGVPLHAVAFDNDRVLDDLEFGLDDFEHYVRMLDSPRFDPEQLYKHELHRWAKTKRPDIKVMLLGQGADEFAGGYSRMLDVEGGDWEGYVGSIDGLRDNYRMQVLNRAGIDERFVPLVANGHPALSRSVVSEPRTGWDFGRIDRVRMLEVHNLWHEDRTAAAMGIENRVPFLDHRLVELLAAIPPKLEPELCWDKRILREVAARWLPRPLVERRKVGFALRRDQRHLDGIARGLARRVFPAFAEKYLVGPDAVFDREALTRVATDVESKGEAAGDAIRILVGAMSTAVFHAWVSAPAPAPLGERGRSPLVALAGDVSVPDDPPEEAPLDASAFVRIHASVRFAASLVDDEMLVLYDGRVVNEIAITEEMAWARPVLVRLASGEPIALGALADAVDVELEALAELLTFFENQGWVTVRGAR